MHIVKKVNIITKTLPARCKEPLDHIEVLLRRPGLFRRQRAIALKVLVILFVTEYAVRYGQSGNSGLQPDRPETPALEIFGLIKSVVDIDAVGVDVHGDAVPALAAE